MIMHNIIQTIFLLAGIIALLASLFNWNWFFTADNARFVVKRLGRGGARIVYSVIGMAFIFAAIFFYYKIKGL